MSDFYVVWNPKSGPPTCRHSDREGAQREAERLALRFAGDEFFVLHAVSVSRTPPPVQTKHLDSTDPSDDGIPF